MTRSAPSTAAALVSTTWSAKPSSATRLRVAAERAVATIARTAPCARAARAIEEPIRPTPISARRLNRARSCGPRHLRPMNSASASTTSRFGLLGADRHAQRIRQLVGRDAAQDQAAAGRGRRRRPPRSCPWSSGSGSARSSRRSASPRARACASPRSARRAISRCARAPSRHARCRRSPRSPAVIAGVLTLNGPRMRLIASTTCAGPYIQPSRSAASP